MSRHESTRTSTSRAKKRNSSTPISTTTRSKRKKIEPDLDEKASADFICEASSDSARVLLNFPDEVLTMITKFLPLSDRKNLRRVCSKWQDACSVHEKKEKFCIGVVHSYNFDQVLATLTMSTRRYFNIEFYNISFGRILRIEFWRTCGPKILSLKLVDCELPNQFPFAGIIKYCVNIRSLEFYFESLPDMERKLGIHTPNYPNKIIYPELKNFALKTLKINFNHVEYHDNFSLLWPCFVETFFDVFPSISQFSFCQYALNFVDFQINDPELSKDVEYGDSILLSCLTRDQMETTAISFLRHPTSIYYKLVDESRITTITEIAIDWDLVADIESISKFARKQVNLKKVTVITREMISPAILDTSIRSILLISSLLELQLILPWADVDWNNDWCTSLRLSKITHLHVICYRIIFPRITCKQCSLNPNLISLALRVEKSYDSKIISFLRTFPNLKNLYLSHLNGVVLKSICANQIKLQSFIIGNVRGGTLSCSDQMNKLKELTRLEIPKTVQLNSNHFNNLKYLRFIDISYNTDRPYVCFDLRNLERYRSLSECLEVVRIDHFKFEFPDIKFESSKKKWFLDVIVNFVAGLKKLKLLCFDQFVSTSSESDLTENDVIVIFENCPSLQMFVCKGLFVKDVIDNRIRKFEKVTNSELSRYVTIQSSGELEYSFLNDLLIYVYR